MSLTLNKKNTVFYYIAIALIAILLAVFYNNSIKVNSTQKWIDHSQIVINKNNEILLDIINIETGARGYRLTNEEAFLEPYNESLNQINKNINALLLLTKDNANQQIRVIKLKKSITERISLSKSLIDNSNNTELELATAIRGKVLMDTIRKNIKTINLEELSLLKQQNSENILGVELSKILLYALLFLLLVLVFFIYYLFKNHYKQNSELELFNKHQTEASQYSLSLIEASLDPLVTVNNEGKITDLNQATVKVTGIDKEHLIGSDFFDYFTNHQKAREVYQDVFSKGSVVDAPLTIRHKDGILTDVLFNGSVYKDEFGTIKGVVIVARDIAEQKWALDLRIANTELAFQNDEKEKRAQELALANKELEYQNSEKEDRANELLLANEELAFQNQEKENRANELLIANKELEYQNKIKEKKAAELIIANKELAFQNSEKEKRAQELIIANKELLFQNDEKQNRADELEIADKELHFQNQEKEKRAIENKELETYNSSLKLTSQYSRSLIEASLDPLVTINAEGKITDVNNASIKVTGVTREMLIGTDFSNYFTEPEKAQKGYRQVFENGYVEDYLLTIKHKNGNLTDVLYNASVYKDDNDNVLGVFAAARDVTEQKKVENVLKESEEKFKLIFEKSTAPIIIADDKGNYLEVNKAAAETFEYSINELMGMNVGDLISTSNLNAAAQYEEYIKKGEEIGEFGFISKKGTPKIVQYQAVRIKPDYNLSILMDVTVQKQSSQYARSLIEASLDPLVTISATGKILDVNEASVKVTGVPREKLIGNDFSNYFTDPTKAQEGYRQVFEQGFVADYPLTIKHKNGNLTDVLYNASVYKDDNGNVLGVFAAARDITLQNKEKAKSGMANKMLEDTNNSLKLASKYSSSLIEASLDPLFTISPEGKITDANQASVNATDVSKENLIGSDFINYFTEPEKAEKGYKEIFSKGFVIGYPLVIKDHKLTYVLFNGSVYKDDNGNVIGAVVVARDISEQKIAEKKLLQSLKEVTDYKLALDASTIVDITDKDGKIVFVNENYVTISKYSHEELIGGNHKMVNSSFHPEAFMSALWNTISKGKVWQNEIKNKDKEGRYYWLNMTIIPFLDEQGIPYQYVAISIDITNQKELEKELTEAKIFAELATTIAEDAKVIAETATSKAEEAVKSKQQFLSNMSHEIRTPMNAIIGFTKVVLKTELTAKQKEYLMAIKMSGDALIVLINDILDLAKVDAGKMTFEKTPFKLNLSIKAMLHLFETKIHEKNLKLITQYDASIPEVLVGDPIRLHQIILNLVSNAVKFTNHGEITVSVKKVSENDQEVALQFAVSDTGIGIKDKKIEQIFENFQQATSGTSRIFGGTGLGLAIVKQLVQAQNGTITVESEFGKGSTFSFILNFMKTTADAVLEPEIVALNTDIKDTKILVVEDMELNQLLMKTILDDFGFECEIAGNGKIAVEKLQNESGNKPFDIVLMDLQMPEMNGFEATEYIRKTMKSSIPIIALTADVTTVDVAKCKAVGMNDYISKPVDERLLYSKLIGLIKKPILIIEQKIIGDLQIENIKYVDMTYLIKLTKSNPKLMTELISSYLNQTPALIKTMKQSFHEKNWKLLDATIHKMLPSFSIMGMSTDITEMARRIQEYANAIELSNELGDLVLELEKVCLQTCIELEIELTNLN